MVLRLIGAYDARVSAVTASSYKCLIIWRLLLERHTLPCVSNGPSRQASLQGNINWMASREDELTAPVWHGREADLKPFCNSANSDSSNLDGVCELLTRSGARPRPCARSRFAALAACDLRMSTLLHAATSESV